MSKSRLEAFSDGVIAIAITLLVLEIKVPVPHPGSVLGHQLAEQWPSYAAYAISFVTIGIIWVNHHAMVERMEAVDHSILMLNLLLLLVIGVLPWSTALMADYLRHTGQGLAATVYSGSLLAMGVAFFALQHHLVIRRPQLLQARIDDLQRKAIIRRNQIGLVPYAIAVAIAPFSAYAALGLCAAVAAFYALPRTTADVEVDADA